MYFTEDIYITDKMIKYGYTPQTNLKCCSTCQFCEISYGGGLRCSVFNNETLGHGICNRHKLNKKG